MERAEYLKMYKQEDKHWWFVAKRRFARVFLKLIPQSKKSLILDVGCGTGKNLEMLSHFGKVFGVDYSAQAIKFCHQRGFQELKQVQAEKLPFSNDKFDLVTFFDVLYHQGVKSDLQALREACRVLKPGGYLLITDCAHQWLFGPHDRAMHARQRYNKKELEIKVMKAGFKIIRSSYVFWLTFLPFLFSRLGAKWFNRQAHSDVAKATPIINKILTLAGSFEVWWLRQVNLPLGSSIMILAQK